MVAQNCLCVNGSHKTMYGYTETMCAEKLVQDTVDGSTQYRG